MPPSTTSRPPASASMAACSACSWRSSAVAWSGSGARSAATLPRGRRSRTAWTLGVLPRLLEGRALYHAIGNFNLPLVAAARLPLRAHGPRPHPADPPGDRLPRLPLAVPALALARAGRRRSRDLRERPHRARAARALPRRRRSHAGRAPRRGPPHRAAHPHRRRARRWTRSRFRSATSCTRARSTCART